MPGDRLEQGGDVGHGAGEGADLVEGRGEGHQAVAGHQAVGGLEPHHPAQGRRLADRPAGVRAQGPERRAGGHRRRRPAGGSARHPVGVPGVAGGAVGRVLGGRPHGELVHVGLAHDHGPGPPQAGHRRGVVGRVVPRQDAGAAGGLDPAGAHVVLDRQRDAGQRAGVPARGEGGVGGGGGLLRSRGVQGQVGVQLGLGGGGPPAHRGQQVGGASPPRSAGRAPAAAMVRSAGSPVTLPP